MNFTLFTILRIFVFFACSKPCLGGLVDIKARKSSCSNSVNPGSGNVEGVLCQDLDTLRDELRRFAVQKAQAASNEFLHRLRSFYNDTDFDYQSFNSKTDELKAQLSVIELSYKEYVPLQIELAKTIFMEMAETAGLKKCSIDVGYPGHEYLCAISELIFRTLFLHTSLETTVSSAGEISSNVQEFVNKAKVLVQNFKLIEMVPFFIGYVFWDKVGQLKAVMQHGAFRGLPPTFEP